MPPSTRSSSQISALNGSSFDGRSGHLNAGGSLERNATRIVLRASPVRRISSLIETPRTKCSLRNSAQRSTSSTSSPWLSISMTEPGSPRPRTPPPPSKQGQISTGEGGSVFHRRRQPSGTTGREARKGPANEVVRSGSWRASVHLWSDCGPTVQQKIPATCNFRISVPHLCPVARTRAGQSP
jgi:hypothetical protein